MNPPFSARRACRSPHGRRGVAPYRLGARAARRRRAPGRDHRRELRARQSRLDATPSSAFAGTRPRRVLGRDRRRGLCEARHHHRHAADRDRPHSRRRSDDLPGVAGRRAGCGTLLGWIGKRVPPRLPIARRVFAAQPSPGRSPRAVRARSWRGGLGSRIVHRTRRRSNSPTRPIDWKPVEGRRITDALYEEYALQSIRIPGARPHPTKLVQSAAMASVAPPKPSYRPHLPANVVTDGLLSDAQLESVIYAGEAHAGPSRRIMDRR